MRYSIGAGPVRVYGGKKSPPTPHALAMILSVIYLGFAVIGGIWAAITNGAEAGLATFVVSLILAVVFAAKAGNQAKK